MNFLNWLLLFIPALLVEIFCYLTNWMACIFVRQEVRTDRVKRLGNQQITMMRDYPIRLFSLWNTHDNALDEYWYGKFNESSWLKSIRKATDNQYDNSWWLRYYCRVAWLMRNNAYGWLYTYFSRPVEPLLWMRTTGEKGKGFWYLLQVYEHSFQLEAHLPVAAKKYVSVNIGYKEHKGFPNKLYANRIIGIRKYKGK